MLHFLYYQQISCCYPQTFSPLSFSLFYLAFHRFVVTDLFLHLHGLVLHPSIYYWQDQPDFPFPLSSSSSAFFKPRFLTQRVVFFEWGLTTPLARYKRYQQRFLVSFHSLIGDFLFSQCFFASGFTSLVPCVLSYRFHPRAFLISSHVRQIGNLRLLDCASRFVFFIPYGGRVLIGATHLCRGLFGRTCIILCASYPCP